MNEKKNKIFLVILLVVFIVIIMGLSYAIFSYNKSGSKINTITLGNLELTLTEGEMINLSDTYPLTDKEGIATTGYDFTLKNTGTASVNYAIYLDNVTISSPDVKLDDKYLKYNLTKNSSVGSIAYLSSLGQNGSRVLDRGTLTAGASNEYILKIWPTTEIDGDFGGQVWKGRLRITGDQVR